VEWMAHSITEVSVRVLARWTGAGADRAPLLLVSVADRVREFSASRHGPPDGGLPDDWLATFTVPIELRAYLLRGLRLRVGDLELRLPGAQTGAVATERPSAQVIDRAVLAERRARRAELAEDSLYRRAAAAEAKAENLERQLEHLEERLSDATSEQDRLKSELDKRERDLKRARQREYAEQQLRVASEENLLEMERSTRAEIERLRGLLTTTESEAESLSTEMEQVRREAAEALNHAREVEHAVAARARAPAAGREEHVVQAEIELEEVQRALEQERRAREAVERELVHGRAQRAGIEGQVQDELDSLRLELARVALRSEEESRRSGVAESLLEQTDRTLASIHDDLASMQTAVERSSRRHLESEQQVRAELANERISLSAQLARAETSLHDQITEQRQRFELQVAAVRDTVAKLGRAATGAVQARSDQRSVEADLTRVGVELERARASTPAEAPPGATAQQLIDDLTRAVVGLRARAPESDEAGVEPEPEADGEPGAGEAPVAPVSREGRQRAVELDRRVRAPWLAAAIARVAETGQSRLAAQLIMELLPVQAQLATEYVCCRLEIEEIGPRIVTIESGQIKIAELVGEPTGADFAISGPASALAALAGGGSRRLRGCRVTVRPRVRRFMRSLRPIGLAEIAAAGVDLTPGSLLTVLSAAVDPGWTRGHSFTVRYRVRGDGGQCVRIEACDGLALGVTVEQGQSETTAPEAGDPIATVAVERGAVLSLLGGLPLAPARRPVVSGDADSATVLADWYACAQGLSAR
jgi:hypothetical protein